MRAQKAFGGVAEASSDLPDSRIAEVCHLLEATRGVANRNGHSALHLAAMRGHRLSCLQLRKGADLTQRDVCGMTPKDLANCGGHQAIASMLKRTAKPF